MMLGDKDGKIAEVEERIARLGRLRSEKTTRHGMRSAAAHPPLSPMARSLRRQEVRVR